MCPAGRTTSRMCSPTTPVQPASWPTRHLHTTPTSATAATCRWAAANPGHKLQHVPVLWCLLPRALLDSAGYTSTCHSSTCHHQPLYMGLHCCRYGYTTCKPTCAPLSKHALVDAARSNKAPPTTRAVPQGTSTAGTPSPAVEHTTPYARSLSRSTTALPTRHQLHHHQTSRHVSMPGVVSCSCLQ
jgi:hypothetical protein